MCVCVCVYESVYYLMYVCMCVCMKVCVLFYVHPFHWLLHLGNQRYSEVEYSGVLHVNSKEGADYVGVVFGYQSNKKFHVAMWRTQNMNLNGTSKAGIKGIQLKVILKTYFRFFVNIEMINFNHLTFCLQFNVWNILSLKTFNLHL